MIFLTVGTQKFQFNRLLQAVDQLIETGVIQDSIVAQCGYSTYVPKNFETCVFMEPEQFAKVLQDCDLVITHGGVGTILHAVLLKKKVIVVPRKKSLSEHVDDHQKEIAEEFAKLGAVCPCYRIVDLEKCYKEVYKIPESEIRLHFSNTAKFLNNCLNDKQLDRNR